MFVALLAGPAHPLHAAALGLFRRVVDGSLALLVTPVIAAELVYVSRLVIGWSRAATAERLGSMLEADGLVVTERAVLRRALALYGERPRLDLADAYLAAAALEVGPPAVASFDADLDGLDGLRRISG